jgi:hypothetical protein
MTSCASEVRRAAFAGPAKIVLAVLGIAAVALTASRPTTARQAGQEQQKPPVAYHCSLKARLVPVQYRLK